MKRISTLTRTTALAGIVTFFALPAQAITCAEFIAMSEQEQQAAIMGIEAGREEARETARGDDTEDAGDGLLITEDDDTEGGRKEQRERARGVDDAVFSQVVDDCRNAPDLDVTGVLPPGPQMR